MGTPNKFNQLLRKSPKYSVFNIPKDVKLTMPLGKIVPIGSPIELMPGDSVDINLQQLTRFMPTIAPVMQRYIIDYVPIFVPYRLLWSENSPIFNAEKFFNPGTVDSDRPAVPTTSLYQILNNTSKKIVGSLFDYLGYPTVTGLYQALLNADFKGFAATGSQAVSVTLDQMFSDFGYSRTAWTLNITFNYNGSSYTSGTPGTASVAAAGPMGYFSWLRYTYLPGNVEIDDFENFEQVYQAIGSDTNSSVLQNEYLNYLQLQLFNKVYSSSSSNHKDLSLLSWLCYHKAVSDWFVRTDIVDPDTYMSHLKTVTNVLTTQTNTLASLYLDGSYFRDYICSGECAPRMWMDDYFTTALSSAQRGGQNAAVMIPVNGTIDQLATAERLNWFRKIVNLAGKRFKDQIYALWGYNIPDDRLQRSEVLGHLKFNMVVSDVLQTSQTDINSALGSYAGQLTSSSGSHLCKYTAPEPGLVITLCSVRPTTAYVDQIPRLNLRTDYYDWENPMFDNVGVQAIMNSELNYKPGDYSVFGYSPRRYAEFMQSFNEVHSQFKTTLDYWHSARRFNNTPGLNANFIAMTKQDQLNRIFAYQAEDTVLMQCYLDAVVSRPLSRYINYHM